MEGKVEIRGQKKEKIAERRNRKKKGREVGQKRRKGFKGRW